MNHEINEYLHFNASHIISVELKPEIASNCKLRSNFVHEKLLETKNNLSGNPLLLKLCNKGLKFLNPDSQALIMSHSIHRISYTACDRTSCQFAMVARSAENSSAQLCHIVRMCSLEEADTINRYIGSLFKELNQKRKTRKSENSSKQQFEITSKPLSVEENSCPPIKTSPDKLRDDTNNVYDDLDTRLRRISTSHIDELVSEMNFARRLSLCIPSPSIEEQEVGQGPQNLHSSLEKKPNNTASNALQSLPDSNSGKPLLRKKSDHKQNKISAVMERLSFRASRDLSADLLKSGSPVVAFKEQIESSDRFAAEMSHSSATEVARTPFPSANLSGLAHSQPKKWLTGTTNDSKMPRKNSAPITLEQISKNAIIHDEQPPVPPVRINSLRNPLQNRPATFIEASPLVRCKRESSSQCISAQIDQDDHLSSITTPSSCGNNKSDSDIDEKPVAASDRDTPFPIGKSRVQNNNKINISSSFNDSHYRSYNYNASSIENRNSSLPLNYFKNFSKDETTDYLLNKELGSFIIRNSASHHGCFALSVKVSDITVSHYIVQSSHVGFQIKGLEKTWPSLHSLITHLSVIPEMLPCTLQIQPTSEYELSTANYFSPESSHPEVAPINVKNNFKKQSLPQSKSAEEEYQHRMRQFLNDSLAPGGQEQYQQLSDFSSMIASFDCP